MSDIKQSNVTIKVRRSAIREMISASFRKILSESNWDAFDDGYYDGGINNPNDYDAAVNPYNSFTYDEPRSDTYNGKDLVKKSKIVADGAGFRIEKCEGEYGDFYRIKGGGSRILFNNHQKYCPANHGIYKIVVANAKVIYHFDTNKGKIVKTERIRG